MKNWEIGEIGEIGEIRDIGDIKAYSSTFPLYLYTFIPICRIYDITLFMI
jgi:hypothetical protein